MTAKRPPRLVETAGGAGLAFTITAAILDFLWMGRLENYCARIAVGRPGIAAGGLPAAPVAPSPAPTYGAPPYLV